MPLERLGLVKTTLLDYPGLVSAVVFTPGCNLRCPWCHNASMVIPPFDEDLVAVDEVLAFLKKRQSVLQGLVVTGGEPLLNLDLPEFLARVKSLGYSIKLDTNGTLPDRLEALRPGLVDYVALDVKSSPQTYEKTVGVPVDTARIAQTLALLRRDYAARCELRLTWVPGLHREEDLPSYAAFAGAGLPLFVTGFRPGSTVDPLWANQRSATAEELERVVKTLVSYGVDARQR